MTTRRNRHKIQSYIQTIENDQDVWTLYDPYDEQNITQGRPTKIPVRTLAVGQFLRVVIIDTNDMSRSKQNIPATALHSAKKAGIRITTKIMYFGDNTVIEMQRVK